jgi:hypothetical protein
LWSGAEAAGRGAGTGPADRGGSACKANSAAAAQIEILAGGTFRVDTGTKTAAATSGAATLNKLAGVITSEALTTAAAATYTLTLTDSRIAAADQVFVSVGNGTNSAGTPAVATVTPAPGSVVIVIRNAHASAALNGTLTIAFAVLKN